MAAPGCCDGVHERGGAGPDAADGRGPDRGARGGPVARQCGSGYAPAATSYSDYASE